MNSVGPVPRSKRCLRFRLLLVPLGAVTSLFYSGSLCGQSVGTNTQLGADPDALPSSNRAQAEPHIVRSPTDLNFLLATFHEGTYALNGGAVDDGYAVSHDGGSTWTRALIPSLTQITGGPYYRASDPTAAIDLNGNAYLCTIASVGTDFTNGTANILVSKSTNGGSSFAPPIIAYQQPANGAGPDKNWLVINNFSGTTKANRLFVAFQLESASSSPIVRTYSDDGGTIWSSVANVSPTAFCDGAIPLYLSNGKMAVVYLNQGSNYPTTFRLEVAVSSDGGTTFGSPTTIVTAPLFQLASIRTQKGKPSAAVDRATGNIYVTYAALSNGSPTIFFTKSTDTGAHWSAPLIISDNPTNSPVFNPAIAVSADGTNVTVCFYDMRNDPNRNQFVDLYLTQSLDGGTTWRQPNTRVSTISSDITLAPDTEGGYMLGDYIGIAEATTTAPAVPIWIDTRNGNPDPFIAQVGIGGSPTPTPTPTATPLVQAVVSYTLVNADNAQDIQMLNDGAVINLARTPTQDLNIRANTSPATVGSVDMILSGTQIRTQIANSVPYALFGTDGAGTYFSWTPNLGIYTLQSTPFTGLNASGQAGTSLTINFTVTFVAPTITAVRQTKNDHFMITGHADPLSLVSIQVSSNLESGFATIGSVAADATGAFQYQDSHAGNFTDRFYRASY